VQPYCDYGNWRPWVLIGSSVVSWAVGFAWLGVKSASKWQAAMALYVLGSVAANISYAYFYAAFTVRLSAVVLPLPSDRD
jgi:hypothetical protein